MSLTLMTMVARLLVVVMVLAVLVIVLVMVTTVANCIWQWQTLTIVIIRITLMIVMTFSGFIGDFFFGAGQKSRVMGQTVWQRDIPNLSSHTPLLSVENIVICLMLFELHM